MAQRFPLRLHHGDPLMVDWTPGAAVPAGSGVIVGNEVWVAHNDIEANMLGAVAAPSSKAVYTLNKGAAVFAPGDTVGWNNTTGQAVTGGTGDADFGTCVEDAGAGQDYVNVRHDPQ